MAGQSTAVVNRSGKGEETSKKGHGSTATRSPQKARAGYSCMFLVFAILICSKAMKAYEDPSFYGQACEKKNGLSVLGLILYEPISAITACAFGVILNAWFAHWFLTRVRRSSLYWVADIVILLAILQNFMGATYHSNVRMREKGMVGVFSINGTLLVTGVVFVVARAVYVAKEDVRLGVWCSAFGLASFLASGLIFVVTGSTELTEVCTFLAVLVNGCAMQVWKRQQRSAATAKLVEHLGDFLTLLGLLLFNFSCEVNWTCSWVHAHLGEAPLHIISHAVAGLALTLLAQVVRAGAEIIADKEPEKEHAVKQE